ncbi:hypothetical protein ACFFRR_009207 [Megaselia abdita]
MPSKIKMKFATKLNLQKKPERKSSRKKTPTPVFTVENNKVVQTAQKTKEKEKPKVKREPKVARSETSEKTLKDTERKRLKRNDPHYRALEAERDKMYKRAKRANPEFRRREQERNTILKRLQRQHK